MLNKSKTWCLREKKLAILRRTERATCGMKMMDRKNTDKLIDILVLEETMDKMAKTNKVRWYRHVSRRESGDGLRIAMEFKLHGQKNIGRPKMIWRKQMEKEIGKVGLKEEDVSNQTK